MPEHTHTLLEAAKNLLRVVSDRRGPELLVSGNREGFLAFSDQMARAWADLREAVAQAERKTDA